MVAINMEIHSELGLTSSLIFFLMKVDIPSHRPDL